VADRWFTDDELREMARPPMQRALEAIERFPLYRTHCAFMNETLPIRWIGHPVYPSDPPADFDRDPCTWYWYKDPAGIPERHFHRHGLERDAGDSPGG
jgi:hypothetical protein